MKANVIIISFIVFLLLYGVRVASLTPTVDEIDNVSYQQLELHRSVLAKQELDTTVRYSTDNESESEAISDLDDNVPSEYKVEVEINGNKFDEDKLTVSVGTTVYWMNDDLTIHTLTLEDVNGTVNSNFGTATLRPGDKIYYKFDKAGVWKIYDPNQADSINGIITVIN